MLTYDALNALPEGKPGPWGPTVQISYDKRDVLLYAVGIGIEDLRYVYESHCDFSVFPTFPIRWGAYGAPIDEALIPRSPLPLMIDAERYLSIEHPLPLEGTVSVQSRVIAVHPKGKGAGFVECETTVTDADGNVCVRMVNGSFRRGVKTIGDFEPFEGSGQTFLTKVESPDTPPDITVEAHIASNQAHLYRLSGDYNPLHIEPEAARFGGFDEPILHGLCTFGHCAHMLLGALCDGDSKRFRTIKVRFSAPVYPGDTLRLHAWHDGAGQVLFEVRVDDKIVVSNAYFEYDKV
jgi:acyl dehydratase